MVPLYFVPGGLGDHGQGMQGFDGRAAPFFCLNPNRRGVGPTAFLLVPPQIPFLGPFALDVTFSEGHTYKGQLKTNVLNASVHSALKIHGAASTQNDPEG